MYSKAYGLKAHSKSLGGQFLRQNLRTTNTCNAHSYLGSEAGEDVMQVIATHDNFQALKAGDGLTQEQQAHSMSWVTNSNQMQMVKGVCCCRVKSLSLSLSSIKVRSF